MREEAPVELPARNRLPPLALPVLSYWLLSGLFVYGIASGAFPFRRWLETLEEPGHASAVLPLEPEPELRVASNPKAPEPPAEPLPPQPPLATEAPAIAQVLTELAPPSTAIPAEPPPAPKPEPPRLAAQGPPAQAGPSQKRLSVSGLSASTALMWRTERDPFVEALPALESPETAFEPPARSRPALPSRPRQALEPAEDEKHPPPRDEPPPPAVPAGSSCEAAVAAYNEEMDLKGGRRVADLPREAFAAVLDRGTYLSSCGVPDTMRVDICAAVQRGRAVGVTVVTRPANGGIQSCVARKVRSLRFPSHPKLDVARTRFE